MAKAVKSAFKWVGKIALGAAGFALKPVLRALTPKAPEVDTSQVINFRSDPNAGIPYAIGRTGTAGVYTYATVGEPKNRNILFHTVLSGGGPIDSFVSFSMGGVNVVFDGADTPTSGPYKSLVWQRRQLGTTPQTYLQPPNTTDASVLSEWDSTHATSGYATAWYVLGADQNAYSGGVPDPLWVLKGVKVYDWRLDSTYPGGVGPQRSNDPSTWAWSENPALHAVTWLLGRYQNGKRVLGLGATMTQIVIAKYAEWANVCDANGWKVGGVVYSTDTKWQVLKAICQAGGAYPVPLGAKVSVIFNAPRVSIATLTGADMEGEPGIVGTQLRRDRFNAAVPRFRSEANGWQVVPAAKLVVADFVTQDGGVQRSKELEWPLVQDVDQATQLAAYAICNSRELGPLDFPVIPYWMGLEPGDCITINEPEYGLTSQKLIIVERNRSLGSFERSITCVTETDSKHAFCLGQSGTAPPLPSLSAVDTLPAAPDPGSWTASGGTLAGPDGSLPVLVLTGSVNDPNVIAIIVEYRLVGSVGDWTAEEYPPTTTRVEIKGLQPGSSYDVRIRYRYARNTEDPTVNLPLPPVTVGGVSASTLGDLTPDGVEDAIQAAQDAADDALTALFDPTSGALVKIDALEDQDAVFVSQIAVLTTDVGSAAGRITILEAKNRSLPNLIINGDGSASNAGDPLKGFNNTVAGVVTATYDSQIGSYWALLANSSGSQKVFYSDWYGIGLSQTITASLNGDGGGNTGATRPYLVIQWGLSGSAVSSSAGSILMDSTSVDWLDKRPSLTATSPSSGINQFRTALVMPNGAAASAASRIMVNYGSTALPFNDRATARNTTSRVTTTEIAQASTDAAVAALTTRVGVSMQQGDAMNANAYFGSYTATTGAPDGWVIWAGATGDFTRQNGRGANYAVRATTSGGVQKGVSETVTLPAGTYILKFASNITSGDSRGAGIYLDNGTTTFRIDCAADVDDNGVTGAGSTGIRSWSKKITIPTSSTYTIYAMHNFTGFASNAAKTIDIRVCSIELTDAAVRQAQADASTALTAYSTLNSAFASFSSTATARLDGLDATVSTQATAIAGVQGRTATYAVKVAAAGADPAYFSMSSDSSAPGGVDSYIAMAAKEIALFNTAGGGSLIKAVSVSGGNAYFPGTIYVGAAGNVRINGAAETFSVFSGAVEVVRLGALP